ncbi:MAG TPA: hypothetical protein VF633_14350 [Brevundimonas sp.]|jgi:hypothetical protein
MTGKDILDYISQPKVRWVMAGVVVVAAVGLGGLALSGRDGGEARAGGGAELSVAVVAPVEPDVEPGGVMDVGELNNGFDGKLPEAPAARPEAGDYYAEQPAYTENRYYSSAPRAPAPRPGDEAHLYMDQPVMDRDAMPVRRENPRAFGFDQPRPDYEREREARRAAMDAREAARQARRERPDLGPDAFY